MISSIVLLCLLGAEPKIYRPPSRAYKEITNFYEAQDAYWYSQGAILREMGKVVVIEGGKETLVDHIYPETLPIYKKQIWLRSHPPVITPEMRKFFAPLYDNEIIELWKQREPSR